jgi:hypothetical protein
MTAVDHGLGRRHAPDPRDALHPMRAVVDAVDAPVPTYKYWPHKSILDQRETGTCVAHAWYSLWMGSPCRNPADPILTPYQFYRRVVSVDEWTDNDFEATAPDHQLQFGSSVRAGAKVALSLSWIERGYVWSDGVLTAARHVALIGPVVLGTNWTDGMSRPDARGIAHYTGSWRGGHAYVWDGVNFARGLARCRNSWGTSWGRKGTFWLSLEDIERLIQDDGECCAPKEIA